MANPAADFDPYQQWLGIPPQERPPNHYRLLGLQPFEADANVIKAAANRLLAICKQSAEGPHAADARRIASEIAAAGRCLLDPAKRKEYDARLRANPSGKTVQPISAKPTPRPPATGVRRSAPPTIPRQTGQPDRSTATSPAPVRATPAGSLPPANAHAVTPRVRPASPPPTGQPIPTPIAPPATGGAIPPVSVPPVVVSVPPVSEPDSELADLFGVLADTSTAAPSSRKRGKSRASAPSPGQEVNADEQRLAGRKKKRSQSLMVLGGLAAITVLMLIVAVVLLFGGGDSPQTATKPKSAEPVEDEVEDTTAELPEAKPTTRKSEEVKPAEAKVDSPPEIAPASVASSAAPATDEAVSDRQKDDDGKRLSATEMVAAEEKPAPAVSAKEATDQLLELCKQGGNDLEIKKLLAAGAKLEAPDANGNTPLRLAIVGKHFLIAKALIAAKASVNATDAKGETLLVAVVQGGDEKLLRLLLDANADTNQATVSKGTYPAGTTPLHVAAQNGNTAAIELLLEHGAHLDGPNQQGATPLMVAAWHGQEDAALALLGKGADVKDTHDENGQTPLMHAAHGGNLAIVKAILAKGVQANYKAPGNVTALSIAQDSPKVNQAVVQALRDAESQEAPVLDF